MTEEKSDFDKPADINSADRMRQSGDGGVAALPSVQPAAPARVGRPRKRGIKPGSPSNPKSGRNKNQATWGSEQVRELALPPALSLLIDICEGRPVLVDDGLRSSADKQAGRGCWRRPTLRDRMKAAETLLNKCVPDVKSVDISQTIDQTVREEEPHDTRKVARAILNILTNTTDGERLVLEEVGGRISPTDIEKKPSLISPGKNSGTGLTE